MRPITTSTSRRGGATRTDCRIPRRGCGAMTNMNSDHGRHVTRIADRETAAKLAEHRRRIADLRQEMRALRASAEPEAVRDYAFATPQGRGCLLDLFGANPDLTMIPHIHPPFPTPTPRAPRY